MQPADAITVVLVRPQGPINLGMIVRLCGNLGVDRLRLVNPQCDPNEADARRFANHDRDRLADLPIFSNLADALADCDLVVGTSARSRDEDAPQALDLPALQQLEQRHHASNMALVFGNEADGLDRQELANCQYTLHLDTPGHYPSYNLSHAVAITLYQLCTSSVVQTAQPELADRARITDLTRYWLGTIERFGYFRYQDRTAWSQRFAELIGRMPLQQSDTEVLRAVLAQFNYHAFGDKAPGMASSGRAPDTERKHEGSDER